MLETRRRKSKIFRAETFNTIVLVILALSLFKTQLTIQTMEDKLANNFSIDELSVKYDCNENKETGHIFCEKKNIVEVNKYINEINKRN